MEPSKVKQKSHSSQEHSPTVCQAFLFFLPFITGDLPRKPNCWSFAQQDFSSPCWRGRCQQLTSKSCIGMKFLAQRSRWSPRRKQKRSHPNFQDQERKKYAMTCFLGLWFDQWLLLVALDTWVLGWFGNRMFRSLISSIPCIRYKKDQHSTQNMSKTHSHWVHLNTSSI